MFVEDVSPDLAAQIESCEVNAWWDLYAAAPADYARRLELDILRVENVVLTRCKTIPFVHFNCVMNLGMTAPATEALLDRVLALYRDAGVEEFAFFHIPHAQPAALPEWFAARNLRLQGGWERICRGSGALQAGVVESDSPVEVVAQATAGEWAAYISEVYGLPTEPWLLALVDRPGWSHYVLRRQGGIAAARSLYVHHDGGAWLGIDAPVPGLMAPSFDLDARICEAMIRDGLAGGARYFVADIEAPSPDRDTPAYRYFEALGFKIPYFRSHYGS
jgi:hypothetical protein